METSIGDFPSPPDAMVSVSVVQVARTACFARSAMVAFCSPVGNSKTRSERSAAMSVRAWLNSISCNARLKPRTPVSEPVPTATARITNRNLKDDARASRQAILHAVAQENFTVGRTPWSAPDALVRLAGALKRATRGSAADEGVRPTAASSCAPFRSPLTSDQPLPERATAPPTAGKHLLVRPPTPRRALALVE